MNGALSNKKWEGTNFSKKTLIWANVFFIFIWLEYGMGLFNLYQIFDIINEKPISIDLLNIISYSIMLISAILIFRKELLFEIGQDSHFWKNFIWASLIFFVGYILTNGLANIFDNLNIEDVNQEAVASSPMYFQIIGVCILAPLAEELYFRFFLYNHFRKKSMFLAITISSVLFAFWHTISSIFYGDFTQLITTIPYIPMGIAFALVYEKTENIKYPILMHIINNTFATLIEFL